MGMQSYGSCELMVNIKKLSEVNEKFKTIIKQLNEMLDDADDYFITMHEYACGDYENDELKQLTKEFVQLAEDELGIGIYPNYIDSEAEGTEYAGELIWCIEPELTDRVKKYADKWTTWSTFG